MKNNEPKNYIKWQEYADRSVVVDDEAGKNRRERPPAEEKGPEVPTPTSNWPYR